MTIYVQVGKKKTDAYDFNSDDFELSGTTLQLKDDAPGIVPIGGIIMWSGAIADIPTNWALCDGDNDTPDLRDKFVIGAKQDDSGTPKTNVTGSLTQSGGAATHTLTSDEMPAHTHTLDEVRTSGSGTDTTNIDDDYKDTSSTKSSYETTSAGGGSAHSILNPYYALAFIMRTV